MVKIFTLSLMIFVAVAAWILNYKIYVDTDLTNIFHTFLALAVVYFLFKIVLEHIAIKKIKEHKTRYSIRKLISIVYMGVFLVILATIWSESAQSLLVAYGIIGAGIAISLQDIFKNFAGGIVIFITKVYSVGDRIEINSIVGDVMDIGLMYTTMMEVKGWVSGDQATGRITVIPNGVVLAGVVNNYTKDHEFIWDEIIIPISYESDWKEAYNKILSIVKKQTKDIAINADKQLSKMKEKYYLSSRSVEPKIYVTLTDNWITFNVRFPALARERRVLRDKIGQELLNEIKKSKKIKIASQTLNITEFPDVKIKKKK